MPVRFKPRSHSAWITAETRNIGVGGAFIASQLIQPVGSQLTLELTLPMTDQIFSLPAIVRWASMDAGGGMGVQFIGVDIDVLLELNDYFSSLTGL
jgi:hypothetical protein